MVRLFSILISKSSAFAIHFSLGLSYTKKGEKMQIIKFGGTATGSEKGKEAIAEILLSAPKPVIAVISAMGRFPSPYATRTLESLVSPNVLSRKEIDRVRSCGELIAEGNLVSYLRERNINAYGLSLQELGLFYLEKKYQFCHSNLLKLLEKYDILIVPGYLCLDEHQEVATMAHGGSDLSAILLAEYFQVKEVTFYKDVDGIYANIEHKIEKWERISYEDGLILASLGVPVLSKEAMEYARKKEISMQIRSFFHWKEKGTIVEQVLDSPCKYYWKSTKKGEKIYLLKEMDLSKIRWAKKWKRKGNCIEKNWKWNCFGKWKFYRRVKRQKRLFSS